MRLSKQTSDAVKVLVCCYRSEAQLTKIAIIAEELGLTKQMALKLSNILAQAGFLDTVRGPNGGVRLSQSAHSSTLGEIVRKIETRPGGNTKNLRGSPLEAYLDEAFEAFLDVLDQHTLANLAANAATLNTAPKKPASKRKTPSAKRSAARI